LERRDVVDGILDLFGPDSLAECRSLSVRFRTALTNANPDLSADMMRVYDTAFEEELPALAALVRRARIEAAAGKLTDEQLAAWRAVLELPAIQTFRSSLQGLAPEMRGAMRTVFATHGVSAHARSSETLFESLSQPAQTAEAQETLDHA
jgi:hypothetical protein